MTSAKTVLRVVLAALASVAPCAHATAAEKAAAAAPLAGWEQWTKLLADFPADLAPAAAEKLWPSRTGGTCRAQDARFILCTAPAPAPGMREYSMELDRSRRVVGYLQAFVAREDPALQWSEVVKLLPDARSAPRVVREGGLQVARIDAPLGLYVVDARPSGALMSVTRHYFASMAARDPSVRIDCAAPLFATPGGAPRRPASPGTSERIHLGTVSLDVACRDDEAVEITFHPVGGLRLPPGRGALYAAGARLIETSLARARYGRAWASMVRVIREDLMTDSGFDASPNNQFVGFPFGEFLVERAPASGETADSVVLRWNRAQDESAH